MSNSRRHPQDKRGTYAWQCLVKRVIQEEPICWLRLAGCTYYSTTADHIISVKERPDLSLMRANVRGACAHCNYSRQDKPVNTLSTPSSQPGLDWFT